MFCFQVFVVVTVLHFDYRSTSDCDLILFLLTFMKLVDFCVGLTEVVSLMPLCMLCIGLSGFYPPNQGCQVHF
jgi:hypothetical protein